MRMATIAAIPFIAAMPAVSSVANITAFRSRTPHSQGLTFYWTFSNSLTVLQAALIKNNTIKRLLNIPQPPPQPKLKNVEIEKPPTLLDTLKAGRDLITNRWAKAKENAEAHQRAANSVNGRQPPKARLAGLEQSEIIREAAPAFAAETTAPGSESTASAAESVVAAVQPTTPASKQAAAPVVRKLSSAQSEKEARVAAARLRRQRK